MMLEMIRNSETKGEYNTLEVKRSAGKIYIENAEVATDEDVRIWWSKLSLKRRLICEEPGIDVQVMYDSLIVRPFDTKAFCRTTLQLPDMKIQKDLFSIFKEMPLQGIVVAVGPGWLTDSGAFRTSGVEIGDHVVIENAISVADFIYNNKIYYKCRSSSISAIMPESYTNKFKDLKFDDPNKK
jgi:co-chaperonin GroES (HSP10)